MGTQQMILYTVATLIVAFVFFILFGVQRRSGEAAIDATRYRAAKQDMLNLVEAIEQDFKNIGSYMYWDGTRYVAETLDPSDAIEPGWYDSTAVAGGYRYWFQFRAQTDSLEPPNTVRYEWEPIEDETVTLESGEERQLYKVERRVDGTLDGSSNTITEMDIELLPDTSDGVPTVFNLEDTRIIRVSLAGVSRLGKGDLVEETRFDAVYRPVPMIIKDNTD